MAGNSSVSGRVLAEPGSELRAPESCPSITYVNPE